MCWSITSLSLHILWPCIQGSAKRIAGLGLLIRNIFISILSDLEAPLATVLSLKQHLLPAGYIVIDLHCSFFKLFLQSREDGTVASLVLAKRGCLHKESPRRKWNNAKCLMSKMGLQPKAWVAFKQLCLSTTCCFKGPRLVKSNSDSFPLWGNSISEALLINTRASSWILVPFPTEAPPDLF